MRFISNFRTCLLAIIAIILFSCKAKKDELISENLGDYLPLQTGKYIAYRLDSLIYTNFGSVAAIHRYQAKHVIDAKLTDNLGRPAYRIYTYLRDSAGTQPWIATGSYFITPLDQSVEKVENNMRVIALHLPLKEGFTWPGDSYLADDPYLPDYDFNNDNDINTWEFSYDSFNPAESYRSNNYTNVWTVLQHDEHSNAPVTDVNAYGFNSQAIEKYAKDIGLVYRKYEIWDYQTSPTAHYTGFGVTMWMIDHN